MKNEKFIATQKDTFAGGGFAWYRSLRVTRKGTEILRLNGWYCTYQGDAPCPRRELDWSQVRPGDVVEIITPSDVEKLVVPSPTTRKKYPQADHAYSLASRLRMHKLRISENKRAMALRLAQLKVEAQQRLLTCR